MKLSSYFYNILKNFRGSETGSEYFSNNFRGQTLLDSKDFQCQKYQIFFSLQFISRINKYFWFLGNQIFAISKRFSLILRLDLELSIIYLISNSLSSAKFIREDLNNLQSKAFSKLLVLNLIKILFFFKLLINFTLDDFLVIFTKFISYSNDLI